MKRITLSAVVLVTTLAAAGALSSRGHAATAQHNTLRVNARITATKRVDIPPKGDSPGDVSLASGKLLNASGNAKVGHFLLDCTNIPPQAGECEITFALPGGHIAILGSFGSGFSGNITASDPIVGGTGTYRLTRGYTDERETGGNTIAFTLHLTR